MEETGASIEYKLNTLKYVTLNDLVTVANSVTNGTITNATITSLDVSAVRNYAEYADKATAEATLAIGDVYVNTTTGALSVALA